MTKIKEKTWTYNGVEFKVGNAVKVIGTAVDYQENGMGDGIDWENMWIEGRYEMDRAIGGVFEIFDIDESGVEFVEYVDDDQPYERHGGYRYPLSVLEKV